MNYNSQQEIFNMNYSPNPNFNVNPIVNYSPNYSPNINPVVNYSPNMNLNANINPVVNYSPNYSPNINPVVNYSPNMNLNANINYNTMGQVRVGTRISKNGKNTDPEYPGFTKILCLTKSTPYGHLGPYVLKDDKGRLMENIWQFSKIWPVYPASKEYYSRFDKTVIWEHPAETHMYTEGEKKGYVTPEYMNWRRKGMMNPQPVRYPAGFRHKRSAFCSFAEQSYVKGSDMNNISPVQLDYITARKKIYLPVYCQLVRNEPDFHKLQRRLMNGENLLIIEIDGPKEESMLYYKQQYSVPDNFIEQNTILVNDYNMNIMLNDAKHSFGHGYCLGLALLNAEQKFCL